MDLCLNKTGIMLIIYVHYTGHQDQAPWKVPNIMDAKTQQGIRIEMLNVLCQMKSSEP